MRASTTSQESLDAASNLNLRRLQIVLSTRHPLVLNDHTLTPASVLLPLYPTVDGLCILLTKRTSKVEHHKGEISFPGGARDPQDTNPQQTALRETYEELGIAPADVRILGELDGVSTRTNFAISTFVGSIPYPYHFLPSEIEVAELLQIPLEILRDPQNRREEYRLSPNQTGQQYAYIYKQHVIFGATARILTQFLELFNAAEIQEVIW